MDLRHSSWLLVILAAAGLPVAASYTNYEVAHVHPLALTPSGSRLVAVNTPDARLEVFAVAADGSLSPERSIPVGLEPVSVTVRSNTEAWVVNRLSDSVSIVDIVAGTNLRTLRVGDEPADVAFAAGKAFVAVGKEDAVKVYDLLDLGQPPVVVPLFSRDIRALAVAPGGSKVYAVALRSGNQTTAVHAVIAFGNDADLDPVRLGQLGLNPVQCDGNPPPYPPLPAGIARNPALSDPPSGVPQLSLIVKWNPATQHWEDDAGQDWTHCLPYRLPDQDLFIIDVATLAVTAVAHLGTTLFDVSVNPANGRIYVPNTDARNHVRFEHPLGVRGHLVDNRLSVVDPAAGNAVTRIDLNAHINRASDPAVNLAERQASVSQPGMMAWQQNGARAWMTAIGSRKLFRIDGACLAAPCIAGPSRAAPDAVVVGEGPTGVALLEGAQRAYVMLRFANSIAVVDTAALLKVGEASLHDPSPVEVRTGRRLLYDGIDSSAHGDAACSSCHISGDLDGLAWDLGNPEGEFVSYLRLNNNLRFVEADVATQAPVPCLPLGPNGCASHAGFDPQKGPMTTQTLRGMLEPLHWRGDRATFLDFNAAFVNLMGTSDIGPIQGSPAGLSAADMGLFRDFALGIDFQPNPNRTVTDTISSAQFAVPSTPFSGNPAAGETIFNTLPTRVTGVSCNSCHQHPFGAAGGVEGGVAPQVPTSAVATALHSGDGDNSLHSDVEVAHLRNIYERFGPQHGTPQNTPDRKTGFGYNHDGAVPEVGTFLSQRTFAMTADQVRDVSAFLFFFPTGTRPAVGRQLTFPQGAPPTGSNNDENVLQVLKVIGDASSPTRHCELIATALDNGRMRAWRLESGVWIPDVEGEPTVLTSALRTGADGPINFLCTPLESGPRLGGDRDEDAVRDGDDCNAADGAAWSPAVAVEDLAVAVGPPTTLAWSDQALLSGPGVRYDVARGTLSALRAEGLGPATACLGGDLASPVYIDASPSPPSREGTFYLVRSRNSCASPGFGRAVIDDLACSP